MGWNNENAHRSWRIVDIETMADPRAKDWLEPVKARANLKDPAKIAADIVEKEADRADKLGLDIDCLRIVCVGWMDVGHPEPKAMICQTEGDERDVISAFMSTLGDKRMVTFYGHRFDLPALWRRAFYLGVQAPRLNIDRYKTPHLDLWWEMTYRGALQSAHSLKFYQKRLGLPSLDKVDGADVAKLAAAGEWDAIRDHCLSDVGLTHALANRLGLLEV